jgi:hypothetical protein
MSNGHSCLPLADGLSPWRRLGLARWERLEFFNLRDWAQSDDFLLLTFDNGEDVIGLAGQRGSLLGTVER